MGDGLDEGQARVTGWTARLRGAVVATVLVSLVSAVLAVAAPSAIAATRPGAPGISGLAAGNAAVSVTWTAPAGNGGSAITTYRVRAFSGGLFVREVVAIATARRATMTSLVNGRVYRFTVTAVNAYGAGRPSAVSAPAVPATVPGAPLAVSAAEGAAAAQTSSVVVAWSPPAGAGGSPVTAYVVRVTRGGAVKTVRLDAAARQATVTGLQAPEGYSIDVRAVNARGTGPASAPVRASLLGPPGSMPTVTATVVSCTETGRVNDNAFFDVQINYTVSGGRYQMADGTRFYGVTWTTQTYLDTTTGVVGERVQVPNAGFLRSAYDPRTGSFLGSIVGPTTSTTC